MAENSGLRSAMKTSEPCRVAANGTPVARETWEATKPLGRIQWAWIMSIPSRRTSRSSARRAARK